MAMVTWLVEEGAFDDGVPLRVLSYARSIGMSVRLVNGLQFMRESSGDYACGIVYGSINLCRMVLGNTSWTPGAWLCARSMECRSYYAHWGHWIAQSEYVMIPFGDLSRIIEHLYDLLGQNGVIFMRPNDNFKSFSGDIIPIDGFDEWYDTTDAVLRPDPASLVVVSKPISISGEWRFVISQGRVITGSRYDHGITCRPTEDATAMAHVVASHEWQPAPIYVLDIALVNGEHVVMELGSVNCAALYGCDIEAVVRTASDLAIAEWKNMQ